MASVKSGIKSGVKKTGKSLLISCSAQVIQERISRYPTLKKQPQENLMLKALKALGGGGANVNKDGINLDEL